MSTQVQRRKGTTAQHASFTGASAELTVDTTKNTVVVHDGVTAGGIPLAKETGSAISVTSLTSSGAASIETTDNTNAALRITQLGTGNALLVEDSANPDASPVVITNNGTLVVGNTARVASSSLIEAHSSAAVSGAPAIANYSWGTLATGGAFNLYKSRSGTVGTQALVASGTQSSVRFYFDDGAAFQQGASIIGAAEGTPALNSMPGRLTFNTTADGSVTPTERMRLDASGNLLVGVTSANANGGILQLKSGITFPATQVAATDANTLDDYEEGSWTAGISFGNASVGVTYSSQTGFYTKVGNLVTLSCYILMTSKGSSTGTARITGLPFTVATNSAAYAAPALFFTNLTFSGQVNGYVNLNATTIDLNQTTALGVASAITDTNFANNTALIINVTYRAQ